MQWSRERCKINLIIVARDYDNTMVVNYIYIVLQSHWKGFGMYSFFYILFWRHSVYVYVCIMYIYVCVCVCIWYAVCACVYLYIYIYMCVCVCVYIYIYIRMSHSRAFKEMFFLSAVIFRILQWWDSKYHCWWGAMHGCSNHSNLEMEAECLTKTLSCLNLNISRTKNGRNKL